MNKETWKKTEAGFGVSNGDLRADWILEQYEFMKAVGCQGKARDYPIWSQASGLHWK